MRHLDLFSGIGGFALAVEKVWDDVEHTFCEIDPFCQAVLKKHWPESKTYGDIKELTKSNFIADTRSEESLRLHQQPRPEGTETGHVHLLTGGFPCQPFSQAGRRKGKEDDRHLWPEMLRVIREFQPDWVVGENVAGIISMVLDEVCTDLENEGYEVQPFVIPAVAVNAPHRRDRVWIVAHRKDHGSRGRDDKECGDVKERKLVEEKQGRDEARDKSEGCDRKFAPDSESRNAGKQAEQERREDFKRGSWGENWLEVAARLCRVDDGLPRRLDRNSRLKALGNAVCPPLVEVIFQAIREVDEKVGLAVQ